MPVQPSRTTADAICGPPAEPDHLRQLYDHPTVAIYTLPLRTISLPESLHGASKRYVPSNCLLLIPFSSRSPFLRRELFPSADEIYPFTAGILSGVSRENNSRTRQVCVRHKRLRSSPGFANATRLFQARTSRTFQGEVETGR